MSNPTYTELWFTNRLLILDRQLRDFGDDLRDDLRARWAVADAQTRQGAVVLCVAFLAALIDLWKLGKMKGGR